MTAHIDRIAVLKLKCQENIPGLSFNETKLIFLAILTGDLGFSVICVVFENDFLAADNRSDDIT